MRIQKRVCLNPQSISKDFERGAINAINDVFPQASVKECHFHYTQSVWKEI